MQYFDSINNQLIYEEEKATPEFWDRKWQDCDIKKTILTTPKRNFVSWITKKYISPSLSVKIIEGGCGMGQYVYALRKDGYDVAGVDNAEKSVWTIKNNFPELKIRLGDIRHLDFRDSSFDAYWSLGVIEHFFNGYDEVAREMSRVLKSGGFLFITFPYMSPLRKIKARLGYYPKFEAKKFNKEKFYQFALDTDSVIKKFEQLGFKLQSKRSFDGLKGLKDEIENKFWKNIFKNIYESDNFILKITRIALYFILAPFAGHIRLLVFKKK